jgi:hypothetical protein
MPVKMYQMNTKCGRNVNKKQYYSASNRPNNQRQQPQHNQSPNILTHKKHTNTNHAEKYNIVVSLLQNYIFTEKNMGITKMGTNKTSTNSNVNAYANTRVKTKPIHNSISTPKKYERFFIPKQKDTLFWCFYIIKNGFSSYEMEPPSYVKEKNEKIKYVELLRERKHLLKEHKIKPISDIEDYLANRDHINLKTFIALCILEGINIIILDTVTYIEYTTDNSSNVFVIHKKPLSKYGIELNDSVESILHVNPEVIQTYRDSKYKILNIDKPILSVSSYKLGELIAICKLLCINHEVTGDDIVIKKRTKQDIYNMIVYTINKID